MYFQTTLAPIDDEGGFFLTVHFNSHVIGGEETRETECAAFGIGNIADPAALEHCLALCTLPRPASHAEQQYQEQMAQSQESLAQDGKYAKSMRAYYAQNALRMRHSARLAAADGLWAPRNVLISTNGRALLGFETGGLHWGEGMAGRLRLVDLRVRRALLDEIATQENPMAAASGLAADFLGKIAQAGEEASPEQLQSLIAGMLGGAGATREATREATRGAGTPPGLKPRQLGAPMAFSADGTRMLAGLAPGVSGLTERLLTPGLPQGAALAYQGRPQKAFGTVKGWLLLGDGEVGLYVYGDGRELLRHPAPCDVALYSAQVSVDGKLLALPCAGGEIKLMDLESGRLRGFRPHTGAPRDRYATLALSPCGSRFASVVDDKLCVTELADGRTTAAGKLRMALRQTSSHDGYVVRSTISPAMAFIGSKLLLSDREGLRIADWSEGRSFISEAGRPGARVPVKIKRTQPLAQILQTTLGAAGAQVLPHHSPALRMKSKGLGKKGWAGGEKGPSLGESRLGGWPDLPADMPWPQWQQRPMAFLAQIDLAQAHAAAPGLRLPASGLLSFFLGCGEETYQKEGDARTRYLVDVMLGTDAAHRGGWRVIHTPDASTLQRRVLNGEPLPELFEPCSLKLTPGGGALPDEMSSAYATLDLDDDARETYNEVIAQLHPRADDEPGENQLMGYPQLIQFTPPELACERASHGLDPYQVIPEDDPACAAQHRAAAQWGLLLQLTSDDKPGFLWGDAGHLYFYGPRAAMERGDFSGVWVNYESH